MGKLICKGKLINGTPDVSSKMEKLNPNGIGTLSLNGVASGINSVSIGTDTIASGDYSFAEGYQSVASGGVSHAENLGTAYGAYSHAEGVLTNANGVGSHAEGLFTYARKDYQHAAGTYNVHNETALRITGNGTSDAERSNAEVLEEDGTLKLNGNIYVNCNYDSTGGTLVSTFSGSYNDLSDKPTIPAATTVVDNLTSTSTTAALSANQGKVLKGLVDSKTSNTGTVTSVAVKMNGTVKGTVTSSGTIDLGTVLTSESDSKALYYGTCSTARNTIAKIVTCSGYKLEAGAKISVVFTAADTSNPSSGNFTLNVNNTGAKNIYSKYKTQMNYGYGGQFCSNRVCEFVYDGTNYIYTNYDTQYGTITQSEITAGTSTTSRLVTPKLLKDNFAPKDWDSVPIGTIIPFGGTSVTGYLLCDGSAVSRTTYADLYKVIGEKFGKGDGSTTFNLPNLAGKFPRGVSSSEDLGKSGGSYTHTHGLTNAYADLVIHSDGTLHYKESRLPDTLKYNSSYGAVTSYSVQTSETESHGVSLTGTTDLSSSLPPYQTVNYFIKATYASGGISTDAKLDDSIVSTNTLWSSEQIKKEILACGKMNAVEKFEIMCGYWGGKPLYRTLINKSNFPISNGTTFSHGIQNVNHIHINYGLSGFTYNNFSYPLTFSQYTSGTDAITTIVSPTQVKFFTQTSWTGQLEFYIVLEYTKTTD